ncbi:sugar kinase [Sphingomonas nostoxanthinifaciens]|uniref:sugar kinase n=1 Tax=Sphingomonas nostoxanthinifaciens TaxID=2872652 RepID=UPI001CC1CAAB|nr:sugar kinase [Sphingomonas nostoxanthinifaciens]UAK26148.1 sugar kinase [Sphingomonas nostoxanthinifaciens]
MTAPKIVCFGELMLRLSPPNGTPLLAWPTLDANFGGAEANVAVALAQLGDAAAVVTALPQNPLGDAAIAALRRAGVATDRIQRARGRLGLYFLTPGAGLRASTVLYDRADSVFARSGAGDYDWPSLLAGAEWLHLSGITPALGQRSAELAIEAATAARALGVRVSLDGNYRANLWEAWDSDPRAILHALVSTASLLIGNHRDVSLLLGRSFSGERADRRAAALAAFEAYPQLEAIASTCRRVESSARHYLAARLDTREGEVHTDEVTLDGIVDRLGTGDAFAAGVLHGLLGGGIDVQRALHLAALKHFTPGDFSATTLAELDAFDPGNLDVRR